MSSFDIAFCIFAAAGAAWLVYQLLCGGSTWRNHLSPNDPPLIDRGFERPFTNGKWFPW